jgi:hypothetical protein
VDHSFDPDPSQADDASAFRSKGSPLPLIVAALVCVVVGILGCVAFIRGFALGLPAAIGWLVLSVWWTCITYAYDATLAANGEIEFRSLLRRRVMPVKSVTEIREARGGETAPVLVIENQGPAVRMSCRKSNLELARRIKRANPAVVLDI